MLTLISENERKEKKHSLKYSKVVIKFQEILQLIYYRQNTYKMCIYMYVYKNIGKKSKL